MFEREKDKKCSICQEQTQMIFFVEMPFDHQLSPGYVVWGALCEECFKYLPERNWFMAEVFKWGDIEGNLGMMFVPGTTPNDIYNILKRFPEIRPIIRDMPRFIMRPLNIGGTDQRCGCSSQRSPSSKFMRELRRRDKRK